ncbi:hypothetical protein EDC04DRAFT_2820298 [Pisolithus marmoratus]|nr:hypothetical protein EDC04DRAFT_2820298 [Pisolithus marmoratus]
MFCTGLAAELGLSALILLVVGSGDFFMEWAGTAGAFHCIGHCGQSCCGTRFLAGLGTVTGCMASLICTRCPVQGTSMHKPKCELQSSH